MAQQTRSIIKHTVRVGDSLERLAEQFMGRASDWLQIAILNGLNYPYISDDADFEREVHAAGEVTFSRLSGSTNVITIPVGYTVIVPATSTAPERRYITDAEVVMGSGDSSVTADVTAVLPGDIGNTSALTVTMLTTAITNLNAVSNAEAIVGGEILNVKLPGDPLLVFSDQDGAQATVGVDTLRLRDESFFAGLLGIDIALDADGDLFADARGGIAAISGLDNLRDALLRRFGTPLAWYVFHPGFGTDIERAIGRRADGFWLQFVRLEVERTLRSDPRVQDVQNIKVEFVSGALTVSMDFLSIGERDPENLVASFTVPGV